MRTLPSTLPAIKHESSTAKPKKAVQSVYSCHGGVVHICSLGELPRDQKQARNLQQNLKAASPCAASSSQMETKDPLYVAIEQCKLAESGDCFVQDVSSAPEPMAIHLILIGKLTTLFSFAQPPCTSVFWE